MRFLLDTCVISEIVRKYPEKKVVDWISQTPEDALFISVLTLGEIQKGIAKLKDHKRARLLQGWLDADLRERFSGRILSVDLEVALTWGNKQGESELEGTPVPTVDGLLAATALAHNLTVATRNAQDIEKAGARVLNPWH